MPVYGIWGWRAFVNVNVKDSSGVWHQYWDNDPYDQIITIDNPYIDYTVVNRSSGDTCILSVIDPNDGSTLSHWVVNTNNIVYGRNPVNSSYSNLYMTRETTLAQNSENLNNGAYMHYAKWKNVHISSPYGVDTWTGDYTEIAGKGFNEDECDTITVNSYSDWYKDSISIDY